MQNTLNSEFIIGKNHKLLFDNPDKCQYKIGEKVEFFNSHGFWIKAIIIGFNVKINRFQAILKCENKKCKTHKICINSLYLRKR